MKKWFAKLIINMAGGISGIIELALTWFNDNVLSKIKDKEEAAAYCKDVQEFGTFLSGVFDRHSKWMSDAKRTAAKATVDAIAELAKVLEDANVTKEELDAIVDKVKACVDAWIAAK